ncbi:MAG: ATP-dependent DNA helicase RecG, partial [Clostridia bacterium]|nr:ATP-dependent DNA helicase RecG [Clostridia bacterium]
MNNIFTINIREIKGVGEKRAKLFENQGIYTLYDLLTYFPANYEDRRHYASVSELCEGESVCVTGWLKGGIRTFRKGRKFSISSGTITDETGTVPCVWYNQPYIDKAYKKDTLYTFYGKVEKSKRGLQMINPSVEITEEGRLSGKIVPIYPICKGIGTKTLQKMLQTAIEQYLPLFPEVLPKCVTEKYELMSGSEMIRNIHFPTDYETLKKARERVVFEEFFLFQLSVAKLKHLGKKQGAIYEKISNDFESRIPFSLTKAQQKVVSDLKRDFKSGYAMNRLVQGDVGSGKTIVAAYGMWLTAENGGQSAMMAPTEILAAQHYKSLTRLFPDKKVVLLTSSVSKKEKDKIKAELLSGEADIAVGTHALIQEDVEFKNLNFVITDEQHRFGVTQRTKLGLKGAAPHVLVMTATPIPRTLGLILYGDLDISTIDELPPGRQEIKTYSVTESYRKRVYSFLEKQIAEGGQAYVICPLVEASDAINAKDAISFAESLKIDHPDINIGVLHGRMKDKEKDEVMNEFSSGNIDVLVSTTVVEVGVDVPDATLMIIENAERFGLSQLHQLRGRVGRGQKQSYCILFGNSKNQDTLERLKVIEESSDGFYISEKDLQLRGPGDFFGTRQHGVPALKTANPMEDT